MELGWKTIEELIDNESKAIELKLLSLKLYNELIDNEWKERAEFLVKRLHRYCGAKSLSDFKNIVLDSLSMSSSMVFHPNSTVSGLLWVSELLLVMILAARFWSFCSWLISVEPAQHQTEQQYRKWGSTIPV